MAIVHPPVRQWMWIVLSLALFFSVTGLVVGSLSFYQNRTVTTDVTDDIPQNVKNLVVKSNFLVTGNMLVMKDLNVDRGLTVHGDASIETLTLTDGLTIGSETLTGTNLKNFILNTTYVQCGMGQGAMIQWVLPAGPANLMMPVNMLFDGGAVKYTAGSQIMFQPVFSSSTGNGAFLKLTEGVWNINMIITIQFPEDLSGFDALPSIALFDKNLSPADGFHQTRDIVGVLEVEPNVRVFRVHTTIHIPTGMLSNTLFNITRVGPILRVAYNTPTKLTLAQITQMDFLAVQQSK